MNGSDEPAILPNGVDHRRHALRTAVAILSVEFKNLRSQRVGVVRIRNQRTQMFEELSVTESSTRSVEDLANKFGYSRRHLTRLFHQQTGTSIASNKREGRLAKAASLLRDPDLSIYNVAKQCGFKHWPYFRNCFKRRFRKTPGQWRKASALPESNPRGQWEGDSDFH